MSLSVQISRYGLMALMALMPLHAFLAIWAGSVFGNQMIWQAWKEAVIAIVGLFVLAHLFKNPEKLQLLKRPIIYISLAYIALSIFITLIVQPPLLSALIGFKTNLAMVLVFLAAVVVSDTRFKNQVLKILMMSSGAVIVFGLIQAYVLPIDFLTKFGYGSSTIKPYYMVDPAIEAVRIVSTLGGPNQLGAFLILPICIAISLMLRGFSWLKLAFVMAGSVVVFNTYSRSAWLGLIIAVGITLLLHIPRKFRMPSLLAGTIMATILIELVVINSSSSSQLQYYIFHQSIIETGHLGPTGERMAAIENGIQAVQQQPWGMGLGTAGPASFYSDQPMITENWYLQLGIEVGLVGLALFIALQIMLAIKLMRHNQQLLIAPAMVGAMAGIAVINLFLHGWADSSTALTYWILAGACLGVVFSAKKPRSAK